MVGALEILLHQPMMLLNFIINILDQKISLSMRQLLK